MMMALLRWMSRWPMSVLHALGALLGWITWLASPVYRQRLRAHADLAGVSPADRRRSVAEAGRMVGEVPWLWLMPAGGVVDRWGAQLPLTVLYRPARKAFLRELEETARHRPGLATAPANLSGVRQMLRALRKGEMVGLLPDQVPPAGQGVWAPFFGRPAYTMTLAQRLVQQTGATLLVLCCERLPAGRGFVVHVLEPVGTLPPAGDSSEAAQVAGATMINQSMEAVIRRWPHQYLWGYHRYKQPRAAAPESAQ